MEKQMKVTEKRVEILWTFREVHRVYKNRPRAKSADPG